MKIPTRWLITSYLLMASASLNAQYAWQKHYSNVDLSPHPLQGLKYEVELQASSAKGKTPLWLNANKYGLSSLEKSNGFLRGQLYRSLDNDSARRWGIGYGLDVVGAFHYQSKIILQQAYFEGRWLHGVLTVGAKEYPLQLKNAKLSSGSQTLGTNARPFPEVRIALPEYWTIPAFGRWLHLKGHIAYGIYTDDNWEASFTHRLSKYTSDVLFHSKSGYLLIGKPEEHKPFSVELGLEMGAQFGGKSYRPQGDGSVRIVKGGHSLKDFWRVFVPSGSDPTDGEYRNEEGNQVGSWVGRFNWDTESWSAHFYYDHFFEDISQMFLLDYDGYGSGDNYMKKEKHRFYLYKLKDMMLGLELNFHHGRWLRDVVIEHLYTKYQSGPYNHDHTMNIPDHMAGIDDYYNHSNFTGWQHWGQVIGNPLYRSPIYNEDGSIRVANNRFSAWHFGLDGCPTDKLGYRALLTYQDGLGTYQDPYTDVHHNVSLLVEANYLLPHNWAARVGYGMDFGHILGSNAGFQITISKKGIINF